MLEEAYAYGCRYFGENKVQELDEKYDIMPKDIHWQMIGHLQRNKVKYIIDKAELIHSVDSIRPVSYTHLDVYKRQAVRGTVHAGATGDRNAFITALSMRPHVMKIADIVSTHTYLQDETVRPSIARLDGKRIYIDPLENLEW